MQRRRPQRNALAAAVLALFGPAYARGSTFSVPVSQGTVTASGIVEASGMAASPDNPNVLWVENDSGNPNSIFAIDTTGHLLGTYFLDGATNTDWEDMSIGPGPEPGVNYIYLANSATGSSSVLVRIPEPTVYASQQVGSPITSHLSGAQSQTFLWPAPNAETMFVDRQNGDIYLGSKETGSTKFYRGTQAQFGAAGSQSLTHVADVPLTKGNGASISPSGAEILVRNQGDVALLYHRTPGQTIAQTLAMDTATNPDHVSVNGTDVEPNAEIVAFDPNGINFYTFSEGLNQKLYKYTRTSTDAPPAHHAAGAGGYVEIS